MCFQLLIGCDVLHIVILMQSDTVHARRCRLVQLKADCRCAACCITQPATSAALVVSRWWCHMIMQLAQQHTKIIDQVIAVLCPLQ